MIITRYLVREISKPLVATCLALVVIFASYSTALFLTEAANGVVTADVVAKLVMLKTNVALEVLMPIAFYLAVVVALGRLYTDSEMTAMFALGVSPAQVLRAVGYLSLVLALIVGGLSLYLRPWSYAQSYRLKAWANAEFDIDNLEPGTFNENPDGTRAIFVTRRIDDTGEVGGVFMQREHGGRTQVLYAQQAAQRRDPRYDAPMLLLRDVHLYDLTRDGGTDRIIRVNRLVYHLKEPQVEPLGYLRKAAPLSQLARSDTAPDIAELEWRLSTPVSTVLLGILGILLGRAQPRQGRYAKMLAAVLVYAAYYSLNVMVRAWVEQGVISPVPGMWWAPALLALLLLGAWHWPAIALRWRRTRAAGAQAP